jgi:hypothetical protein
VYCLSCYSWIGWWLSQPLIFDSEGADSCLDAMDTGLEDLDSSSLGFGRGLCDEDTQTSSFTSDYSLRQTSKLNDNPNRLLKKGQIFIGVRYLKLSQIPFTSPSRYVDQLNPELASESNQMRVRQENLVDPFESLRLS